MFILESGLRIGEIIALQWDHISSHDDRLYVHVQQTAAITTNDDEDNGLKTMIHIGQPKTAAGERIIPVTQNAARILARCKARQKVKTDFVFAARNGSIMQERNIRRALESFCKQLGINHLTVHELRHTFSTRMYEVGIPSEERARIMGHADSRTTDRMYVTVDINSLSTAMSNYENGVKKLDGCYKTATTMTASLTFE
ncbi:MAG: site-specific integrase [Clostridiaceae bacterium]|nr:site-specific integrase [Clostridiaceae bacterium]